MHGATIKKCSDLSRCYKAQLDRFTQYKRTHLQIYPRLENVGLQKWNWRNLRRKLFNYWLRLTVKIACWILTSAEHTTTSTWPWSTDSVSSKVGSYRGPRCCERKTTTFSCDMLPENLYHIARCCCIIRYCAEVVPPPILQLYYSKLLHLFCINIICYEWGKTLCGPLIVW